MDVVDVPAGRTLIDEGVLAYEFMVIRHGTAEVTQAGRHLRDLGPGDYIGEIGLLQEDRRRSATVTTTSPLQALVMTGPEFRAMVREIPEVGEQIKAAARERLEHTTN